MTRKELEMSYQDDRASQMIRFHKLLDSYGLTLEQQDAIHDFVGIFEGIAENKTKRLSGIA